MMIMMMFERSVLIFQIRKQSHEHFKGSAKINATKGGAPEHFDHSSNVKEIVNSVINFLQRETRISTPLGAYRENIRNATTSDFVLFESNEAPHVQTARLLRVEVSNAQNGNAMMTEIRKIDNEIYKRIVNDE